jgi:hypothetical protein
MIYRVNNLDDTASTLRSQGWKEDKKLEIPSGPCYTFRDPAGNAIAIYENQRPEVVRQFNGRIDKNKLNKVILSLTTIFYTSEDTSEK